MSSCQLQPQSEGTWTDIFPENQVSQQQSTMFMKKLLAIAVSNIAFMRVIFPDKAFSDKRLDDLNLKILKNDKSCPPAAQMIDWLKGVFDALDKKYLRMLIIGFHRSSSDPDTLLEMYTFRFSYTDTTEMEIYSNEKKISSSSTASQTKKATISLLRSLIALIQSLGPLPDDVRITMKLFYYDDVTPEDYEPPGFRAADADFICMEGNPTKFRFQSISTSFHSMQLRVIADAAAMATEDESVVEQGEGDQQMSDTIQVDMDVEMVDTQPQEEAVINGVARHNNAEMWAESEHCSQPTGVLDVNSQAEESCSDVSLLGVRCPCLANEDDGLMIECSRCHYWQHAVCFKVLDQSTTPARHFCNLCSGPADEPTDPELAKANESEAQMISLWRRSLAACLEFAHISSDQLASRLGIASSVSSCIIDRLVSEGYVVSRGKSASALKYVQKRKIKHEALLKYFNRSSH